MGWTRKWVNNTSGTVNVAAVTDAATLIKDDGDLYGYAGSVVMAAYSAVMSDSDNDQLDAVAAVQTFDKYLNGLKVYFPGPTGYLGSFGATGYTGSRGATGYKGSA